MTLKEHIDEIRNNLEEGLFINEAAVSDSIVRRLLDALDWPIYNPQLVFPQYPVEGGKVDFALCHPLSKPLAFIEVKQVGNIEGAEEQLFRYAFHKGVPIAILTDGQKWRFFHPTGEGEYRDRKVHEMDLIEGDSEENFNRLNRYLNYQSIRTGEAIRAIKDDYENVLQQRQIEAHLPEVWSELVEEKNEYLLLAVMEKAKNKVGYEPTEEQVLGFLKSLERKTRVHPKAVPPPSIPKPILIVSNKKSKGQSKTPAKRLVVTMPSGEVIEHHNAMATFSEVIEKLGIEQVRSLERLVNRIPLISTSKHPVYNQQKSGRYYIMTNTSTTKKKTLLEEIASDLDIQLKVEIVDKS